MAERNKIQSIPTKNISENTFSKATLPYSNDLVIGIVAAWIHWAKQYPFKVHVT